MTYLSSSRRRASCCSCVFVNVLHSSQSPSPYCKVLHTVRHFNRALCVNTKLFMMPKLHHCHHHRCHHHHHQPKEQNFCCGLNLNLNPSVSYFQLNLYFTKFVRILESSLKYEYCFLTFRRIFWLRRKRRPS